MGPVQFLSAEEPVEEAKAPAAVVHDDLVCVPSLPTKKCAVCMLCCVVSSAKSQNVCDLYVYVY